MKNKFVSAVFLTFLTCNSYAGGITNGLNLTLDNKVFVFAVAGVSRQDVVPSLGLSPNLVSSALDDSATIAEIGGGYKHSKSIFSTLSFQKNTLEISTIQNVLGSLNYQFSTKKAKPFIGVLMGYSKLKWSRPPHQVQLNQDLTSTSYLYGVQIGLEQKIKKNLSLLAKYQFIKYKHRIEIVNNTNNIEHRLSQNLLLGFQYVF